MKNRTALIYKIPWWLGFTWSPSHQLLNGHGYSWIGKKIRRKKDIDWHTVAAAFVDAECRRTIRDL